MTKGRVIQTSAPFSGRSVRGSTFHYVNWGVPLVCITDSSDVSKAEQGASAWIAWLYSHLFLAPDLPSHIFAEYWMQTIVDIQSNLDPRLLQVNRRLRGGHWVPTEVKRAMETVRRIAQDQVSASGWTPAKDQRYRITVAFSFKNSRSDIDGPVKRLIDAVFQGIREAIDSPSVNDSRVVELNVTKAVGEPSLSIQVDAIDTTSGV